MTTNKTIAEKINVFLNLLFHLEDYVNNQKTREEQLHIAPNVKLVLKEVSDSPIVKQYFYRGTDVNRDYDEKEIEPEFRLYRLNEERIAYIKKANPQSFNQKDLQLLNYFFNSSGEAALIYDLIKYKMLSIIKFCLSQIFLKKYKEKEKEIYSKINFVLISNNNNKLLKKIKNSQNNSLDNKNKFNLIKKNRSLADLKDQFRLRPNFIIPPPIIEKIKNNEIKIYEANEYYQTNFPKNYKLVQDLEDKKIEKLPKINNKTEYKNKIKISPSSQLDLIHILHSRKKKPYINDKRNLINEKEKNKSVQDLKAKKISMSYGKSNNNYKNENKKFNLNEFDYNKIFNMFDAIKKRGYIY